jgi:cytochrome c-type biogenesis protein CcmE
MPNGLRGFNLKHREQEHDLVWLGRFLGDGWVWSFRVGFLQFLRSRLGPGNSLDSATVQAGAGASSSVRAKESNLKSRHKRLAIGAGALAILGGAVALVLNALQSNVAFFFTPTQITTKEAPVDRTFRLGGLVVAGSVKRQGVTVNFSVTDTLKTVPVKYDGILPDLFKEGKGVVAQGRLHDGVFEAREVLAKHDENYMPPEAAEALKRAAEAKQNTSTPSVKAKI